MAEYIEREKLMDEIYRIGGHNLCGWDTIGVKALVERQPTADVVEVVRCKDCKYHHWEQEPCHGKTEHFCSVLNAQVFKDFYCYHGAKMDGKGESE